MKSIFSRSFLLGLGSGLIFSAFIAMIFIASSGRPQPIENPPVIAETPKVTDNLQKDHGKEVNEEVRSEQIDKIFTISKGDSAAEIANRLVKEQWIKSEDKNRFLTFVSERKLANRFIAGKYVLVPGLTVEEIVNRLT